MSEDLKIEQEVFKSNIDKWRETHLGKYVLIKESDVIGFYDSLDAGFKDGLKRYGIAPFFLKQILPKELSRISLFGKRARSA